MAELPRTRTDFSDNCTESRVQSRCCTTNRRTTSYYSGFVRGSCVFKRNIHIHVSIVYTNLANSNLAMRDLISEICSLV